MCDTTGKWAKVAMSRYNCLGKYSMQANGPAIKGGCVTWRSHPATDPGTLAR